MNIKEHMQSPETEKNIELSSEQSKALLEWLAGRRHDIEEEIEDMGSLKILLDLLNK